METQGPIVAFNLLNPDGTYVGFAKVLVSILYLVLNTSFTSNAAGKTYHFANSTIWKIWTQMSVTFDLESNLESSYSLESNCTDILPRVSYFNFWWFVESHFGGCFCLFAPKFW